MLPLDSHPVVIGLGEILWDFLPTGRQLGGAPANFAYAAALLGNKATIASRIGADELGDDIVAKLAATVSTENLQRDSTHPTGTVKVRLDHDGKPNFEIVEPVAWDFLEWTENLNILALRADAVCFGSLAQRSPQSRETIRKFLRVAHPQSARVFDVNLRQSFYSTEVIHESLKLANIVKLNHDELPTVAKMFEIQYDNEESAAQKLRDAFNLNLVCVTRGDSGSLLVSDSESDEHPGFKVQVADTVGAGDAFTAGLVHQYLTNASLQRMNDLANRMGAWVSTQSGAMPVPSRNLKDILSKI
jgi:fructokinase